MQPSVFHDLTLTIAPGYTFTSVMFNNNKAPDLFTITASNGGSSTVSNAANSDNQFTTIATAGPGLTWATIHSDIGFKCLEAVRDQPCRRRPRTHDLGHDDPWLRWRRFLRRSIRSAKPKAPPSASRKPPKIRP